MVPDKDLPTVTCSKNLTANVTRVSASPFCTCCIFVIVYRQYRKILLIINLSVSFCGWIVFLRTLLSKIETHFKLFITLIKLLEEHINNNTNISITTPNIITITNVLLATVKQTVIYTFLQIYIQLVYLHSINIHTIILIVPTVSSMLTACSKALW